MSYRRAGVPMHRGTFLGMPALALAAVAGAGVPAVGQRAPVFTLPAASGDTESLTDIAGKKNLVLVFLRGVW